MSIAFHQEIGPRAYLKIRITTLAAIALIACASILMLARSNWSLGINWSVWAVLLRPELYTLLLEGVWDTLRAAFIAMILASALGSILAIATLSARSTLQVPIRVAVEMIRGSPPLLLIFFIYLGGPRLGVSFSPFWALVIALTLYNSVMIGEIIRAGIVTLPKGQAEAGLAVGLQPSQVMIYILLPQAIRNMLPALISQLVVLLKETSLGFIIGYTELMRNGRTIVEYLGGMYSLPVYLLVGLIYLCINLTLSYVARRLKA